jgi:hypothetical protein
MIAALSAQARFPERKWAMDRSTVVSDQRKTLYDQFVRYW